MSNTPKPRKTVTTSGRVPRVGKALHGPHQLQLGAPVSVDEDVARFRYQKNAVGKLSGEELNIVRNAFGGAYEICASAMHEAEFARKRIGWDRIYLWNGYHKHPESSLAYWFGTKPNDLDEALSIIVGTLSRWEFGFRCGFHAGEPVFLRRKSRPAIGNPAARHLARNVIELCPPFFDKDSHGQVITLLHEMGHWSSGRLAAPPRDMRTDLCSGGWNRKKNMCYRFPTSPVNWNALFTSGNPRNLALAFDSGNTSISSTIFGNIDNYVCYMWNRWVDREGCVLRKS